MVQTPKSFVTDVENKRIYASNVIRNEAVFESNVIRNWRWKEFSTRTLLVTDAKRHYELTLKSESMKLENADRLPAKTSKKHQESKNKKNNFSKYGNL